jgi:putative ABC transport system substrate-binding protein
MKKFFHDAARRMAALCALLALAPLALAAGGSLEQLPRFANLSSSPAGAAGHAGFGLALHSITLAQLEDQLRRPETQASLGKGSIAVLYPNVADHYRQHFTAMIQGIEERTKVRVRAYAVDAKADVYDLNAQLKRNGVRVVIALGRQGISTASALDRDIMVLAGGALLSENENLHGISLTPDPAMLFARLKSLLPEVRRVLVVYDPRKTEWLVRIARDAARAHGLELVTHEARDLGHAAQVYSSVFAGADNRRDAVWLPHDTTTVEEGTLVPLILKESWNSSVATFSSTFLHVKRGALFAMTPDNVELGRSLASSALGLMSGETRRKGVQPLREVRTAINLRTASHVGLNIGFQQQRTFDYIYPEP